MGFTDIFLMTLIITGALYLLYRSIWKKQGHCPGCDAAACNPTKKYAVKACKEQ